MLKWTSPDDTIVGEIIFAVLNLLLFGLLSRPQMTPCPGDLYHDDNLDPTRF